MAASPWTQAQINIRTRLEMVDSNRMSQQSVPMSHPVRGTGAPSGMVLIPAGSFTMGNCLDPGEGRSDQLPLHTNFLSAFYMDQYEVSKLLWDEVRTWAVTNGYGFDNAGSGKAMNHPVHTISWYDAVKWCNARSQKEGLTAAFYTDAAQTAVYRTGQVNVSNVCVKWMAGYRLPTEAEWEKAARGGANGHRFPWADVDTISHKQANYHVHAQDGTNYYAYDISPKQEFHPSYATGDFPYTSPVGAFEANGYGLYDMAGNVWEWCWGWYDSAYYGSSPGTDPRGPTGRLSDRVLRGGSWNDYAYFSQCALRLDFDPGYAYVSFGFRCVRGL